VPVSRPRARTVDGHVVLLQSFVRFATSDVLSKVVLERMLAGVATARLARLAGPSAQPSATVPLQGPVGGVAAVHQADRDRPGRAACAGPDR